MYDDFKDIEVSSNNNYFIGSIEFDAINTRLKQYIIDDDTNGINKLFNKYDADQVLFKKHINTKEDTERLLSLFNLASTTTQLHLLYNLVNTKKFADHISDVFPIISNVVYMKDKPSLFKYFLQVMEDKEYLFETYSDHGKFAASGTILNNIFSYYSINIFNFLCQSNDFIQSLNTNKDWKFIKSLTNQMTEQLPNDRVKMLEKKINQINPMLNTLFDANPLIKEKIEAIVINTLNRFINDNSPYYLAVMYSKVSYQFFDNLYVQGIIDYKKEITQQDESSNDMMSLKMKDYIEESDFKEVTCLANLLNIDEKKMNELEKQKLEKMMPENNEKYEKRIKI